MGNVDKSPMSREADQFRAMAAAARSMAERFAGSEAHSRFEQICARYERFAREAEEGPSP